VDLGGLELSAVRKSYGDTLVLESISLSMEPCEFIAFLGPSGSGKSTLLRIIAGLETADSGEVMLNGKRIDGLAPGVRDIAMVFQHYALYPHMTVRDNMAFGLRNARVGRDEIATRIAQAAAVLEIEALLDRKPGQLSGGQRQRVAIGRAIVKQPKLFLLDEPLSNLDAALRNRTRVELAQLRRRVEAGVIMVTHDQAEAMTLADRIVVMNDRRIQQIGTPMEVYSRPANTFVAGFVGSPAIALLSARLVGAGQFAQVLLDGGAKVDTRVPVAALPSKAEVRLGLRPEGVRVVAPGPGTVVAEVMLVERLGDRTLVYARLAGGEELTATDEGSSALKIGDPVALAIDGAAAHIFGPDGTGYHAVTGP
jgi:multiple sugar transport system ATP-binding protein